MKFKIDESTIFELTDVQIKTLLNDIHGKDLRKDLAKKVAYIIFEKYNRCFSRLYEEWKPKLEERDYGISENKDEFCRLVFSQGDYKDRDKRDLSSKDLPRENGNFKK